MKKVLVGFIQDGKHSGIDKYLLSVCEVAFENGIQLDFLTTEKTEEMAQTLQKFNFGLFQIPSLKRPFCQYRKIKEIIENGNYDGVYLNISEAFNCMGLVAAKIKKVPVRIVHSHASGVDRKSKYVRLLRTLLNSLFKGFVTNAATKRLAPSNVAGEWLFCKDYEIIYNAVDGNKFRFSEEKRKEKRAELELEDKKVFLHIGNFCYAKNHYFLMDTMKEIIKTDKNVCLLCVGTGYDFDNVCEYAKQMGIYKQVRFLGVRQDVSELLSAADVFIFPSRFEGLPIACVEAQFSGIPCVLSDSIAASTKIAEKTEFLPTENATIWAETALRKIGKRTAAELDDQVIQNFDLAHQKEQLLEVLRG